MGGCSGWGVVVSGAPGGPDRCVADSAAAGVPVNVKLDGLDALLSTMQLPSGVPVATVGIDNGRNAALLAARILALSDAKLAAKLKK